MLSLEAVHLSPADLCELASLSHQNQPATVQGLDPVPPKKPRNGDELAHSHQAATMVPHQDQVWVHEKDPQADLEVHVMDRADSTTWKSAQVAGVDSAASSSHPRAVQAHRAEPAHPHRASHWSHPRVK